MWRSAHASKRVGWVAVRQTPACVGIVLLSVVFCCSAVCVPVHACVCVLYHLIEILFFLPLDRSMSFFRFSFGLCIADTLLRYTLTCGLVYILRGPQNECTISHMCMGIVSACARV